MRTRKVETELDERSQKQLYDTLHKDPADYTVADVGFLLGRQDYLDKEEIKEIKGCKAFKKYEKQLAVKEQKEKEEAEQQAAEDEE